MDWIPKIVLTYWSNNHDKNQIHNISKILLSHNYKYYRNYRVKIYYDYYERYYICSKCSEEIKIFFSTHNRKPHFSWGNSGSCEEMIMQKVLE